MSDSSDDKYAVGFTRPPLHSRFAKGKSGNPAGRPKAAKNLATIIEKTISEQVVVTENGQRRTISKLEAMVKQLTNKAAGGDHRSIIQLLQMVNMVQSMKEPTLVADALSTEADRSIMDRIITRIRGTSTTDDVPYGGKNDAPATE
jgi:DNA polymerase III delta prime subunit